MATDLSNTHSAPRIWTALQETPLRRTVWVHIIALGTVLITQGLLGIIQNSGSIVLFGLSLVVAWIAIEAVEKLAILQGLPLSALTIATALEVTRYPEDAWVILSLTAGLAAWDTYHLLRRTERVDHIENAKKLEALHLRRLLVVLALGSVVGFITMITKINLGFGLMLVLGLLAIFGIGQAVRYLRKNST